MRVLFAFGGAAGRGLAEIDQPASPGRITLWQEAFGDGQLVHRQLGVALGVVLADRGLAGLDVDDHQPALAVAFQPVEAAAHPHPWPSPRRDAVDVDLGAHLGELVAGLRTPLRECRQHRAVARQLVVGIPLRIERQLAPELFELVEHLALGLAGLGDQGVQQRTERRAHVTSVGAAVAFEQPAQRAVGQRLQRRR